MAAFQVGVPGLVHFLLLIAASAAMLELPSVAQDTQNLAMMGEKKAENSLKVDYRSWKCMPPITEQFIFGSDATCSFTQWALPAVAMAEYTDCMSSKEKVLRDFSPGVALRNIQVACITPNFKKVTDALDYLIYAGVALNATYYETEDGSPAPPAPAPRSPHSAGGIFNPAYNQEYRHFAGGPSPPPPPPSSAKDSCQANKVGVAYKLKKGYQNIRALNERMMAKQVKQRGPILATLYLDLKTLDTDFGTYSAGIMDSDKVCPTSVTGFSYPPVNGKSTDGIMLPVMVVGYGKLGRVDIWIVRNDWHGPNWGMGGYFYLKRGANACGIAFNPIRVLSRVRFAPST